MNIANLEKLPFYNVYYTTEPLQAKEDLKTLFKDSARFHNEEIARDAFLYFVSTARKFGFQLFFKAPAGFFNTASAEAFNGGFATPKTHIPYNGLPNFKISEKFN